MLWTEYMDAIALRMREPDATESTRLQADLPYVIKSELEEILVMSLNQALREVPETDWEAIGPKAIRSVSGGAAMVAPWQNFRMIHVPPSTLRILTASVDNQPTVHSSLASLVQSAAVQSRYTNTFGLFGNLAIFRGTLIKLTLLIEPTKNEWKTAQRPILPAGMDIRVLEIAQRRIQISDYVPVTS